MQTENYEPQINLAGLEGRSNYSRRRQMFVALILILTALILVVAKYRGFWFDSLGLEGITERTKSETVQDGAKQVAPTTTRKNGTKQHMQSVAEAETQESPSVQAVVLPPMQVDVTYSNGRHQTLVARDSAVHLSFSPETEAALMRPVDPVYPLAAQQENLQGAVVLMAHIDKSGSVESVQVLSGPDILANAAVEAVKQWRFKPRADGDPALRAESRVTVNFTISAQ
jgi:TonB family protein